jgi:outer membrane protein insertion porin family
MSLLTPPEEAVVLPDDTARADWLQLDLRVVADDSIAIDTAYGRFNVGATLRVQGRPAAPRLSGSAAVVPGGVLYVGGRRYLVESGVVQFRGSATTRPDITFNARTSVGGYDIILDVQTRGDVTETTLQSDPPLPEEDIASLLLAGQKSADVDAADAVTEQLVATLSGELVGAVGRAIGLDAVRVEQANPGDVLFDASVITTEATPAQRLTFSKRVFPDLEVIFSQSLRESGDITWVVSWQPLRGVELRFVQLDDEDRSYEIRHDLSFGGGVKRKARARRRREEVRTVGVSVAGGITEAEARALLKLDAGDRFDFYDWQGDRDRLERWLVDNRYYEGRVIARRDPLTPPPLEAADGSPVDLRYTIDTGPRTELVVTGADVPDHIRRELAAAWVDVPVDSLLEEEFAARLRPWLAERGYLESSVEVTVRAQGPTGPPVKTATVAIAPGPRYAERAVVYSGIEGLAAEDLDDAIEAAGLKDRAFVQPADARAVVLAACRREGFLSAQAVVGDLRFEGARAVLPIRIAEGPRFRAGAVTITGGDAAPEVTAPIEAGAVMTDRLVAEAVRELGRRYRRQGYRARVTAQTTTRPDGGTVDVAFTAVLGQPSRLEEIRVAGATDLSKGIIDRTLDLTPGEPLSPGAVSRARQKLYDTGVFRTVSIDTEPIRRAGDGQPPESRRAGTGQVRATITVEELPRYRFRYGFQLYDPSSPLFEPNWGPVDPGVVADLTRRGLFGRGFTGGIGARLNPSEETVRAYLSSRTFFGLPAQTNVIVGTEDTKTTSAGYILDSRSQLVAFDQRLRWRRLLQVGYGYSFEQRTFDVPVSLGPLVPGLFPVEFEANIGRLLGNIVFDERDNVLNTRQGPFHSSSIDWGPTAVGSTRAFYKYLGQQFYFVPWKQVTFGAAARLELSGGPGRGLLTTERLRVGGANTVRGYEDDTLSLRDIIDGSDGRTGILVLNQETRFPVWRRVQGAAFWDYAHIYGETGDFTGLRVRNSLGAGIRVLLPFIVVRVDYGYPLNQDERNDKGRWYFAIGQAF